MEKRRGGVSTVTMEINVRMFAGISYASSSTHSPFGRKLDPSPRKGVAVAVRVEVPFLI
jgi:hypothetical protein